MAQSWGYTKQDGPHMWGQIVPIADIGMRQSPIDIIPREATYQEALATRPLRTLYLPQNSKNIINNGKSIQVCIDGADSCLTGGPLEDDRYEIVQFHFHWGKTSKTGSEHTIDGRQYASELHLVHYNTTKFASFAEAAKSEGGLAVLGVFLTPGSENAALNTLAKLMSRVQSGGDSIDLPDGFDPASLLPEDKSKFWSYSGSLTTPPCFESVNWIVFKEPIEVSEQQLEQFRQLKTQDRCCLVDNFRPPCPTNGRAVASSFRKFFA